MQSSAIANLGDEGGREAAPVMGGTAVAVFTITLLAALALIVVAVL